MILLLFLMKGHGLIMRKVFLSIMLLGELKATKYISDDFNLNNKNYYFPLSFIADEILEENDEAGLKRIRNIIRFAEEL